MGRCELHGARNVIKEATTRRGMEKEANRLEEKDMEKMQDTKAAKETKDMEREITSMAIVDFAGSMDARGANADLSPQP